MGGGGGVGGDGGDVLGGDSGGGGSGRPGGGGGRSGGSGDVGGIGGSAPVEIEEIPCGQFHPSSSFPVQQRILFSQVVAPLISFKVDQSGISGEVGIYAMRVSVRAEYRGHCHICTHPMVVGAVKLISIHAKPCPSFLPCHGGITWARLGVL